MQTLSGESGNVAASSSDSLVGRLADEMAAAWRAGARPIVEDYLDRHPILWDRQDLALELIAEEMGLRDEYGETMPVSELTSRFPHWEASVRALEDCQRAFGGFPSAPRFPQPGEWLGDFRLIRELGRGSHGCVFLAAQESLADRLIVLKLSAAGGGEHLSLARLQHTHIVPLYSTHDFPDRGLRGLCLPYCGGKSLAAILTALAERPTSQRTGADLLAALAIQQEPAALPALIKGPMRAWLGNAPYVEAIVRLGVCLAEALQFAHDRDLLHLDLKPSNVLIAADGTPMLLDFHLASSPLAVGASPPINLGGTPGYMAPELAAAISAVRSGGRIATAVDGRADVYSLGVLLEEALGHDGSNRAAHLSTGLKDILNRCTAPVPADRYPTAGKVAQDLRRHLAHRPLRGVPNRSLRERWSKWRRRSPFSLPVAAAFAALAAAAIGGGYYLEGQVERAARALDLGEEHLKSGRFSEAVETLRSGESVLDGVPFQQELSARIQGARERAERGQSAAELHRLAERLRSLYCAEDLPRQFLRDVEAQCRSLWTEREEIVRRLDGDAREVDGHWRADLHDVAVVFAHLHVRAAETGEVVRARQQALDTLAEAESLLGPSAGLCYERAVHARALSQTGQAVEWRRSEESRLASTTWERLIIARGHLLAGEVRSAADQLDRCLSEDPGSLWANYYRGLCALRLGEPNEATAYFSACTALAPRSGWFLYQRGLAHHRAGRTNQARADLNRAAELDPTLAAAGRTALR